MMKKKVKYAFNKTFALFMFLGILFLFGAVGFFGEQEFWWALFFLLLGILFIGGAAVLLPCCYRFDPEGLSIYYALFSKERYLWKNIWSILETYDSHETVGVFHLLFSQVFSISGAMEGKNRFYMRGYVYKSFRTKRLLEQYWDGEIEGNLWNDTKKWWRRKVSKKQKAIKQHLTDEIVPLERKVRAEARAAIKPFADQAAQKDLVLHTQFLYITKDQEELHSRPHEGYSYTALVEISRPGEQDEDKIICVSVDLLQVRLGKTAYKGAEKRTACEELQIMLRDTIEDIHEYGI